MTRTKPFGPIALASALLLLHPALAQQDVPFHCSTHSLEHLAPFHHNDPHSLQRIADDEADLEAFTQQYAQLSEAERGGSTYVLPVVFHIIHNNGPENISDAQVYDAIRVLNDDFNKLNADWDNVRPEFLGIVADVGITFRLAQLDPDGNCTSGINRIQSILTNDGTQDMKDLIQWPRNKYLNVWVCAYADGAAGYTLTPGSVNNPQWAAADGIVLLHNYTGSIGTSSPGRSRTLTHEVGHWINLRHTWGPTNEPGIAANCNEDDNVGDTPNTEGWTSCTLAGATCNSTLDNVENYMEYSYCSKMFTEGQKTRMLAALNSGTAQRNQLWQPSNLAATGTTGTDVLCAAAFTSDLREVCSGGTVQFTDVSYHGATTWEWSFPGGTPSTSTDQNPVVTYGSPGLYPVTLVAGNGNTQVSTQVNNYVMVMPAAGLAVPYSEGFEATTTLPNADWALNDAGGNGGFQFVSTTGYQSSKSVRLNNYVSSPGEVDELVSNTLDMSSATDIVISYRYAYAQRNTANNDVLKLYVSKDCGESWSLRDILYGTGALNTASLQTSPFTPSNESQWAESVVDNISTSYHVSEFRFKFEFESDGGNNLFIDNINVNGAPVGMAELVTEGSEGLRVVPNPAGAAADLVMDLRETGPLQVQVMDPVGRLVAQLPERILPGGLNRLALPVDGLAKGVYLAVIRQNGRTQLTRFTKE
ncbi:MAG: choice-of-anchor J domain-containing protein [Flavobacteriales bacterium]|nr:choice-of-anchor J domain-containing protein [Flavobacteriales bacterium]